VIINNSHNLQKGIIATSTSSHPHLLKAGGPLVCFSCETEFEIFSLHLIALVTNPVVKACRDVC